MMQRESYRPKGASLLSSGNGCCASAYPCDLYGLLWQRLSAGQPRLFTRLRLPLSHPTAASVPTSKESRQSARSSLPAALCAICLDITTKHIPLYKVIVTWLPPGCKNSTPACQQHQQVTLRVPATMSAALSLCLNDLDRISHSDLTLLLHCCIPAKEHRVCPGLAVG